MKSISKSEASAGPAGASTFEMVINGKPVRVENAAPTTTLLDYLRGAGRTGSKLGCAEGDCGACTVALVDRDAAGRTCYRTHQQLHRAPAHVRRPGDHHGGGLGRPGAGSQLHPVQACLVDHGGSQCGFCTPGFAVSLFEGYYRPECRERWQTQRPALRQSLPLHGLPADPRRGQGRFDARSPESLAADPFNLRLRQRGAGVGSARLPGGGRALPAADFPGGAFSLPERLRRRPGSWPAPPKSGSS